MNRPAAVWLGTVLLVVYALAILSIHRDRPWELLHEDNGGGQTAYALSHVRFGLGVTRAHNVIIDPRTDFHLYYPKHPPGLPLLLAAAFVVSDNASPASARTVVILFSVAGLLLLRCILSILIDDEVAILGACFVTATLPMQAFMGRMVNYESTTLFFVLVQLLGYLGYRTYTRKKWLGLMAAGVVIGGFIDWASFFFSFALGISAIIDWKKQKDRWPLLAVSTSVAFIAALDISHIVYATGSLAGFKQALLADVGTGHEPLTLHGFLFQQIEHFRDYFTHTGLVLSVLVLYGLARPASRLGRSLFHDARQRDLRWFLWVTGAAAAAYVIVFPSHAQIHHYWLYYFIPYVAVCFALLIRWLRRRAAESRLGTAAIATIILIEVVATSAYKLHRRYTHTSAWAIEESRRYERLYVLPVR